MKVYAMLMDCMGFIILEDGHFLPIKPLAMYMLAPWMKTFTVVHAIFALTVSTCSILSNNELATCSIPQH